MQKELRLKKYGLHEKIKIKHRECCDVSTCLLQAIVNKY